jgi:hypothetical protein
MAKSAKRKRDDAVTTAVDRSAKSLPNRSALVTHSDVARRAYDLYLARGCHMDTMLMTGCRQSAHCERVPPSRDFSEGHHEND